MSSNVRTNKRTDKMLSELSMKRKSQDSFIKSKQDIVAEAVEDLYKKEAKKWQEREI